MSNYDYTSRDYASIQADLLSRAERVMPEWTNRDSSDFGMLFVDLWSYMGDVLHYYVDRAAGETSLQKATQRESVLAVASLLDYIPDSRTSASTSVVLDASNSDATDADPIVLPRYWRFNATPKVPSASDVIFTLDNAIAIRTSPVSTSNPEYEDEDGIVYDTFSKNDLITVNLTEGEYFTEVIKSTGKSNQKIQLTNTGVVSDSITVAVSEGVGGSEVVYSYVPRLIEASSSQPSFSIDFTASDRTILNFGNNINGKVPLTNADITVTYRRSRGAAGNLPPNSIKGFESLVLPDNRSIASIIVNSNTVNTLGGSDSESIASMKASIPLSFRTQDRAVSLVDYRDLTLGVPGVSKATALVTGGSVVIYALSMQGDYQSRTSAQNSIALETTLSSTIQNYLSTRSVVGVSFSITGSTSLSPVRITARINVLDGYIQEKVKESVKLAIAELFTFDNCSYGMQVSLGTLYRVILAVPGVNYATITQFTKTSSADTIDNVMDGSTKTFEGVSASNTNLLYLATDLLPVLTMSGGIVGSAV